MKNYQWDMFFETMDEIVSMPGPWKDKARMCRKKAEEVDASTAMEEFLSWFDDDRGD